MACHTSDPGTPDGPGLDGSAAAGMHVVWTTNPPTWPGQIEDNFTLDSATFAFDNLKVIGDAGPGDPRTTATAFKLHWDAQTAPAPIDFSDAPTGVYSKVSFQIDGHLLDASYRLKGHVQVNGVTYPYELEDQLALSLSLQCNRTLAPGASESITVLVAFHDALAGVDWSLVHNDGGQLEMDTSDPQMPAFRAKFTQSFSIDNSGPN